MTQTSPPRKDIQPSEGETQPFEASTQRLDHQGTHNSNEVRYRSVSPVPSVLDILPPAEGQRAVPSSQFLVSTSAPDTLPPSALVSTAVPNTLPPVEEQNATVGHAEINTARPSTGDPSSQSLGSHTMPNTLPAGLGSTTVANTLPGGFSSTALRNAPLLDGLDWTITNALPAGLGWTTMPSNLPAGLGSTTVANTPGMGDFGFGSTPVPNILPPTDEQGAVVLVPTVLNTPTLEDQSGYQSQFPLVDPAFIADILSPRVLASGRYSPRIIWQARTYDERASAVGSDQIGVWQQKLVDCFFELDGGNHIICRIYFDPVRKGVMVEKRTTANVILSHDDGVDTVLEEDCPRAVKAEKFLLRVSEGEEIRIAIAFIILPRPFRQTTCKLPVRVPQRDAEEGATGAEPSISILQPLKRRVADALEPPAKRGRQTNGMPEQIRPPLPLSHSPLAAVAEPQHGHVIVDRYHSHASSEPCCYTLTTVRILHRDGSVFVARHSGLAPATVVAKKYRKASNNAVRAAKAWQAEYLAYRALGHPITSQPFLVNLIGTDTRVLHLYLEHVVAPDLSAMHHSTYMFGTPGSPISPRQILCQIVSALEYTHSCGVTHNDIKPGNILLDRRRGVVLCDWGLATIGPGHGHLQPPEGTKVGKTLSHLAGTCWYLAPEVKVGVLPKPSRDIFAVGVIGLWLFGHIPLPESLKEYIFSIHQIRKPQSEASRLMDCWQDYLSRHATKLRDVDPHEKLTKQMLLREPHDRPLAAHMRAQFMIHDPSMEVHPVA